MKKYRIVWAQPVNRFKKEITYKKPIKQKLNTQAFLKIKWNHSQVD